MSKSCQFEALRISTLSSADSGKLVNSLSVPLPVSFYEYMNTKMALKLLDHVSTERLVPILELIRHLMSEAEGIDAQFVYALSHFMHQINPGDWSNAALPVMTEIAVAIHSPYTTARYLFSLFRATFLDNLPAIYQSW
jgi:hypothetical protein